MSPTRCMRRRTLPCGPWGGSHCCLFCTSFCLNSKNHATVRGSLSQYLGLVHDSCPVLTCPRGDKLRRHIPLQRMVRALTFTCKNCNKVDLYLNTVLDLKTWLLQITTTFISKPFQIRAILSPIIQVFLKFRSQSSLPSPSQVLDELGIRRSLFRIFHPFVRVLGC